MIDDRAMCTPLALHAILMKLEPIFSLENYSTEFQSAIATSILKPVSCHSQRRSAIAAKAHLQTEKKMAAALYA